MNNKDSEREFPGSETKKFDAVLSGLLLCRQDIPLFLLRGCLKIPS